MRFDRDSFWEIMDTLTRNKRRTILTGFGVFWGMFMLLFLLGGSGALKSLLISNFEGFATNSAFVFASPTSKPYKGFDKGRTWRLVRSDKDRLARMVPELDVITMTNSSAAASSYGNYTYKSSSISGVDADFSKIETPSLIYGRYINHMDVLQEKKVCVLGKMVYESLFPEGGDPCGEFVKVGNVHFMIVGVDNRTAGGVNINGRTDRKVTIPISTFSKLFNRGEYVDLLCYTVKEGIQSADVEARVREVVARNHSVDPADKEGVNIFSLELVFGLMDSIFRGLDILMLLVGIGTILAGAIGVSNIMMVTVKERTTEIGIRRAIGATPSMILSQVIIESMLLTVVSGMIGIVFTVFLLNGADAVAQATGNDVSFQITIYHALSAMAFLAVLGILAGLAPASRAMKIKPVDAMRDE